MTFRSDPQHKNARKCPTCPEVGHKVIPSQTRASSSAVRPSGKKEDFSHVRACAGACAHARTHARTCVCLFFIDLGRTVGQNKQRRGFQASDLMSDLERGRT